MFKRSMPPVSRRLVLAAPLAVAATKLTPRFAMGQASPAATSATWESAAPLEAARSEFAATVHGGQIYVAGGFEAGLRFDRFDPVANRWEQLADLPEARHHLSLAAIDDAIYLAGGHNETENSATDTFWRYDLEGGAWETLEPLPQGPRGALGAAAIDGVLYVVAGSSHDLSGPATGDLARYDPAEARWELLAPMPTPREHLGVAAASGLLVAVGGRNGSHEDPTLLSATELYDPATDTWETRAALPVPRAGMGIASDGERIIIMGGERFTTDSGERMPETFDAVDLYDVAADHWSALTPLPVPRHGIVAAIVDGSLYAIGGSTVAGTVANTDRVDLLTL